MPRTAISSETLRSAIEYGLYTFYSGRSRTHHRTTISRFPGVHVTCCEQASTYGCRYCYCWHHFVEFIIVETIEAAASLYELCVSHLYTASVPRPTDSAPPPRLNLRWVHGVGKTSVGPAIRSSAIPLTTSSWKCCPAGVRVFQSVRHAQN